jgi:fibronectin-binding autotransporter adhesin
VTPATSADRRPRVTSRISGYQAFSGSLGGAGGLRVEGGEQTLTGGHTFSGTTSVARGAALALAGSGSLAASSAVVADGTFDIAGAAANVELQRLAGTGTVLLGTRSLALTAAADTFAGTLAGNGGLTVAAGTQTLAGSNAYTGATAIAAGAALALGGAGSVAASSQVVNRGTLDIAATDSGATVQRLSGDGSVVLGSRTLRLKNAADTFSGSIAGSGGVAVLGGRQTLTGINTYRGGPRIADATLAVAADASLGHASGEIRFDNGTLATGTSFATSRAVVIDGRATFDTAADTTLVARGAFSGNGAVVKQGAGTLELAGDNRNWGSASDPSVGGITVASGLVRVRTPTGSAGDSSSSTADS